MALQWHPQAEFRLRSDIQSANIDPAVMYIKTWGCVVADIGGAKYRRMASAPADTTNFGYVQSADGAWWCKVYDDDEINIAQFGARPSTASTFTSTNNVAVLDAHDWCAAQISGKYIPLTIPDDTWRLSQSIPFVEGMVWQGCGRMVDDFFHGPTIRNSAADMFTLTAQTRGCMFDGIGFDGVTRQKNFVPDTLTSGFVLQWSTWQNCAFKNFDKIFRGTYTFLKVIDSWLNSSNYPIHIKGSDCTLDNLNVGGQGSIYVDPITQVQTPARATDFVVTLETLHLSRIGRLFVTGRPSMPLRLIGNLNGTKIWQFWSDIADYCGVYGDGAHGFELDGVTVNKCQFATNTAPHATYKGLVQFNDCHDYRLRGTQFSHNETTGTNPGPISPPFAPTHYITASAAGNAYNAYIDDLVYRDYYTDPNIFVDANADWPRLSSSMPRGTVAMTNANQNGLVADLRTVILNVPLTAARTFFLNTTRAKVGDKRLFKRTTAATGNFAFNIASGLAGSTFVAVPLPTGNNLTYEAVFDGTVWR